MKSQRQAILNALLNGETLTTLTAVKDFGTVKLPTRIGEFEKKYDFECIRQEVEFKTRYKTKGRFLLYSMRKKDAIRVKKILKNVA